MLGLNFEGSPDLYITRVEVQSLVLSPGCQEARLGHLLGLLVYLKSDGWLFLWGNYNWLWTELLDVGNGETPRAAFPSGALWAARLRGL